jgi:very-short-patch-repair endonuclease
MAPLAREKRRKPTPAEARLWQALRNRRADGVKFRRQYGIERFIVDFYSAGEGLVIEVDGDYHQYTGEEDAIRQEYLEAIGLRVMRVRNDDVMKNLEGVVAWIGQVVEEERKKRKE